TCLTNNDGTNSRITFDAPLIPTTNNISATLHKKNSKSRLKVHRPQKDQTLNVTTQESEGELESSSIPNTSKNSSENNNQEIFVKPGNRRRRRKTKSSKNNPQQNSQESNNQSEQRSSKHESLPKHDHIQQNINGTPRSRQSDEMSYTTIHPQQPRQIAKLKTEDHNIWQRTLNTETVQYQAQPQPHHSQQRSDQTSYYMQGNKRNETVFQTTIPAKATLPEINKKAVVFPRRNSQSNITSNSSMNSSMNKFTSYAGAISSQNRPPPITTKNSHDIPSTLPGDNTIMAPVPAASVRNATNHQWYSPFGSGLSIQFNPPVPPEDIHNKWASNNSVTSASLFSSPMPAANYRRSSLTSTSPISNSNESTTSISVFASSPFSTLTNHDRRNSTSLTNFGKSSLTNFGKLYDVHDQEKGELTNEKVEASELNLTDEMIRGRSLKSKILNNKDKMSE
ncbi:1502_t:CDS:1, partial [Cetraspora pellucida]